MNIKIKTLIIPIIILYLILATMFSYATSAVITLIVLGIIFVRFFAKKAKQEYVSKYGIGSVPKNLVYSRNTILNDFCVIRYFSGKKITIMENPKNTDKKMYKVFIVDASHHENIGNCWSEICSIFDEYSTVESVFSYIDKASGRYSINFFNLVEYSSKIEGMEDFIPKIENDNKPHVEHQKQKFKSNAENNQIIVDFNDFDTKEVKSTNKIPTEQNIVDMQDLSESDKIDVNLANAEIISSLPGINIVMAKKIVEYRNLNGFFSSKESFIKVSEVKESFKEKILNMITVESYSLIPKQPKFAQEQERTVD